ncbi:MAG: adhesin [Hyphomicrobium sp.]
MCSQYLPRAGASPAWTPARVHCAALLLLAAALSGCASSQAAAPSPSVRVSASAVYSSDEAGNVRVDLEDDGLPSQPPPRTSHRVEPDDPSEPFSPNYGRAAASPAPQSGDRARIAASES